MSEMKLKIYDENYIASLTKKRVGETRLGEKVKTLQVNSSSNFSNELSNSKSKYVLLGLPEDIGVRANFGRGGAYSAWQPSLNTLLNVQSNHLLIGDELLILGHIDFSDIMLEFKDADFTDISIVNKARSCVTEIDDVVYNVVLQIIKAGKEPIIIGGGHNNAFPNLKATADGLFALKKIDSKKINCINCDAHSDLRPLEGRHSGNAFSYAYKEGFLDHYAMIGLHEIFNTGPVHELIQSEPKFKALFFDDIFVKEMFSFKDAIHQAINFTSNNFTALELDVDTIQNIPSSAKTSSGISTIQARQFVYEVASKANLAYFHLAEAAPVLSHIKTDLKTGKLLAYLITDYIKARNSWHNQHV